MSNAIESAAVSFTQPAKLDKDRFNSIFLLSIGTFLETFDLFLYTFSSFT